MQNEIFYNTTFLIFLLSLFLGEYNLLKGYKTYKNIKKLEMIVCNKRKKLDLLNNIVNSVYLNDVGIDFFETRMRFLYNFYNEKEEVFYWKDECGEKFKLYNY